MKFLALYLCLLLHGAFGNLQPADESFFQENGIETQCEGNTTFGSFSWCTARCDNLNDRYKDCGRPNQLGCTCKNGYFPLNDNLQNLRCVKPMDCPEIAEAQCEGNTTYGSFSWCIARCDNLKDPYRDCGRPSQLGCKCKNGYFPLNDNLQNLRCVKPLDCPEIADSKNKQVKVTPPTLPLANYSAVEVEHQHKGDCQGNKTYGYFADCGERCDRYPKYCQKEKVLRCGCRPGHIQMDSTFLSPCVLPQDCPKKAKTFH